MYLFHTWNTIEGKEGKVILSAVKFLNTQHDVAQSSVYNYLLGVTDSGGV